MTIVSKAGLAAELQISRPRISQYLLEGMPQRPDGKLDREKCLHWIRANIASFDATKGGGRASAIVSGKTEGKAMATPAAGARLTHAEAIRKKENFLAALRELEYLAAIERVVEVSEATGQIDQVFAAVRLRLSVIPSRVADRVALTEDPDEARAMIEAEVIAALEDLSLDAGGWLQ